MRSWLAGLACVAAAAPSAATAAPVGNSGIIDHGNTAFLLVASALVLFMTMPGLALFYGGLVRAKNFLSVLMHCFAIAALVSILWLCGGYGLAFDPGNAWIGTLHAAGLAHLDHVRPGTSVPENVFALYQMMFAIITPALIVGAFPERVRFGWLMLFSAAVLLVVYVPVAHWVWGGGWMAALGVRDFAGGIVVHSTAGIAALVLALMIGPRRGFPEFAHPSAQPGDDHGRSRHAVGGVVRLQRRFGTFGRCAGRRRGAGDASRRMCRGADLDTS